MLGSGRRESQPNVDFGGQVQVFERQVQTGDDPNETRYGCYLPVLTGLASGSSAASLRGAYSMQQPEHGKARQQG